MKKQAITSKAFEDESIRRETILTRLFRATIEQVFDAWTDPLQVQQWWGPKAFNNVVYDWEARPGGLIRMDMIGPDLSIYPMHGNFHEVCEPERLLFTSLAFTGSDGNPQLEVLNTLIFLPHGHSTRLTLQAVVIRARPEVNPSLESMEQGWTESLDKLEKLLQSVI